MLTKAEGLRAEGKLTEALIYYDDARKINHNDTFCLLYKGIIMIELNKKNESQQIFDKLLATEQNDFKLLEFIGDELSKVGDYETSLNFYDKSFFINSRPRFSLIRRAICLQKIRRHEEAIECIDKVLKFAPENIRALKLKAISLYALRKYR